MEIQGVTETVTNRIRAEIIAGVLAPGSRLNEIDLSARLGVSRPPLREAFRKLEGENLVVSVPRKGSFVTRMSLEDCTQIYRARIMLECAAIEIIGEQGIDDLAILELAMQEEQRYHPKEAPQPENLLDYFDVMARFHNKLVEVCANRWVIHCYGQLRPTMARYQLMYLRLPGSRQASLDEHAEVLALIRGRDFAEAKRQVTDHILKTRDALILGITNGGNGKSAA